MAEAYFSQNLFQNKLHQNPLGTPPRPTVFQDPVTGKLKLTKPGPNQKSYVVWDPQSYRQSLAQRAAQRSTEQPVVDTSQYIPVSPADSPRSTGEDIDVPPFTIDEILAKKFAYAVEPEHIAVMIPYMETCIAEEISEAYEKADMHVDPSSTYSCDNPYSADSRDFPDSADSRDFPVSADSRDFPVSADSHDFPVSADSRDFPVSADSCDNPVSADSCDNPVSADSCDNPVSADSCDNPVSADSCDNPVSADSCDNPVSADSCDSPVSVDSCDNPVSADSRDFPVSADSCDNHLSADSCNNSFSADSCDHPVSADSGDHHFSADSGDHHFSADSGDHHFNADSGDHHFSADSGNHHFSADLGNHSFSEYPGDNFICSQHMNTDEIQIPTTDEIQIPTTDEIQIPTTDEIQIPTTDENTATISDAYTATINDAYTATINDAYTATINDAYTATINAAYTATINDAYTATINDAYTATITDASTAHHSNEDLQFHENNQFEGPEISDPNKKIPSSASTDIDFTAINIEYGSLVELINLSIEPYRSQLSTMLFPMFFFICLSAYKYKKIHEGLRFIEHFQTVILEIGTNKLELESLKNLMLFDNYCNLEELNLGENKTSIYLAPGAVQNLMHMLHQLNSSVLLPMLHLYFNVEEIPFVPPPIDENTSSDNNAKISAREYRRKFIRLSKSEKNDEVLSTIAALKKTPIAPPIFYEYLVESMKDKVESPRRRKLISIVRNTNSSKKNDSDAAFEQSNSQEAAEETDENKPPYSLEQLIVQAILSTPNKQMTFSDICFFIAEHYEFYRSATDDWQERIRNSLSTSKCFIKALCLPTTCETDGLWRLTNTRKTKLIEQEFRTPYGDLSSCMSAVDVTSDETLLAFSFGGNTIYIACIKHYNKFREIKISTKKILSRMDLDNASNFRKMKNLQWFPDCLSQHKQKLDVDIKNSIELFGHTDPVYALKFDPTDEMLLSASEDTTIIEWSMKTFRIVRRYFGHTSRIVDIDISKNSLFFATASSDHTARFWSVGKRYPVRDFVEHADIVQHVRFHPTGNYIMTACADGALCMSKLRDGKVVRTLKGHKSDISALTFVNTGKQLISADYSRRIIIWDLAKASILKELFGHQKGVLSLSVDNNNSYLASTSFDQTVRIWDIRRIVEKDFDKNLDRDTDEEEEEDKEEDKEEEEKCSPEQLRCTKLKNCPQFVKYISLNNLMVVSGAL